jgi:hypothetical protein
MSNRNWGGLNTRGRTLALKDTSVLKLLLLHVRRPAEPGQAPGLGPPLPILRHRGCRMTHYQSHASQAARMCVVPIARALRHRKPKAALSVRASHYVQLPLLQLGSATLITPFRSDEITPSPGSLKPSQFSGRTRH